MMTCVTNSRRAQVCSDGKNFLEQILVVDPETRGTAEKLLQVYFLLSQSLSNTPSLL